MIAGGDDGSEKAGRVLARRPTIRPRPVTPPRSATTTPAPVAKGLTWKLPPVRLPSPRIAEARAAARPVLLLVADASDQFEIARGHESSGAPSSGLRGRSPWSIANVAIVVAVSAVVLVVAALAATWASSRPSEQLQTSAASPRATARATTAPAMQSPPAAMPAPAASPDIPVVDVKSLPPAPRSR